MTEQLNYTGNDGRGTEAQQAYDRGYFDAAAGIRVNRTPVWRRIAHYVVPVVTLCVGIAVGASMSSTPTNSTPTIPPQPTRVAPPAVTTQPATNAKDEALTKLFNETQTRGSLSGLTKEQLKTVMDTFICAHQNDLLALSQGGAGVSGSDAGFLYGANSVIGYC